MRSWPPRESAENDRRCHYCGVYLFKGRVVPAGCRPDQAYTRDHVNPRSKGGGRTVPCCLKCNGEKKTSNYEAFYQSKRSLREENQGDGRS